MNYTERVIENQKRRGHELLPQCLRGKLPKPYTTEGQGMKATAQAKFFTPDSDWYWYVVEFDGADLFYGMVAGNYIELGNFRLSELEAMRGPWHLPVERDNAFDPTLLWRLRDYHVKTHGKDALC